MGTLKICLPDDVEEGFRRRAMHRFGYSKGSLSHAAEEAFKEWGVEEEILVESVKIKDPVFAISGLLKHVKKSSVELQHEIGEVWGKRYARH